MRRLAELIDREAGGRAVAVGLSLGGYVLAELAGAHPERLAGLVLSGCSWVPKGPFTLPFRAYGWLTQVLGRGFLTWLQGAQTRVLCPAATARSINEAGFSVRIMPEVMRELAGRDVCASLSRYPGPVLVLNGKWDFPFRLDERALMAAAPQARLEVIRGAGHLSNLHRPAAFNEAVRRFASSVAREVGADAHPTTVTRSS